MKYTKSVGSKNLRRIPVAVNDHLYIRIRRQAERENRYISNFIKSCVEEYLKQNGNKQ